MIWRVSKDSPLGAAAVPCDGFNAVAKLLLRSVVLPEPEGPIMAMHSPASAASEI